jgi:transposase
MGWFIGILLDYEDHNGIAGNVTNFCCDMSSAFISGIESNFENADITFDRFHVMKLMNEAIDQVRRQEQAHNASLKRTRYIWLKNPENLTEKQMKELGSLKGMQLKTSRAYGVKQRTPQQAAGYSFKNKTTRSNGHKG